MDTAYQNKTGSSRYWPRPDQTQ